ncbi:hypothetical protein Emed_002446 [Eimeria media]
MPDKACLTLEWIADLVAVSSVFLVSSLGVSVEASSDWSVADPVNASFALRHNILSPSVIFLMESATCLVVTCCPSSAASAAAAAASPEAAAASPTFTLSSTRADPRVLSAETLGGDDPKHSNKSNNSGLPLLHCILSEVSVQRA